MNTKSYQFDAWDQLRPQLRHLSDGARRGIFHLVCNAQFPTKVTITGDAVVITISTAANNEKGNGE